MGVTHKTRLQIVHSSERELISNLLQQQKNTSCRFVLDMKGKASFISFIIQVVLRIITTVAIKKEYYIKLLTIRSVDYVEIVIFWNSSVFCRPFTQTDLQPISLKLGPSQPNGVAELNADKSSVWVKKCSVFEFSFIPNMSLIIRREATRGCNIVQLCVSTCMCRPSTAVVRALLLQMSGLKSAAF